MRGRRLLQTMVGDWFLQEAFYSWNRNSKGKKYSSDKHELKIANRKFRHNKTYKKEIL